MSNPIDWTRGKTKSTTGLNMAWQSAGHEASPTILLVGGLGCQLTVWHDEFCLPLLQRGYRLIRFDNRDAGLSDNHPTPRPANVYWAYIRKNFGLKTPSNYTLETMADDTLGLVEALELNKPHVVGLSMGGMIAQIMMAKAGDQLGKLVTMLSSTNSHKLPGPSPKVLLNMFIRKPKTFEIEDIADHVQRLMATIGSPAYPTDPNILRERTRKTCERAYNPAGVMRQTHCVAATGSIEHFTRRIKTPTCIIHGKEDPLLSPACAERIHELIPNSQLHLIEGLAHDLPDQLTPVFSKLIDEHIKNSAG